MSMRKAAERANPGPRVGSVGWLVVLLAATLWISLRSADGKASFAALPLGQALPPHGFSSSPTDAEFLRTGIFVEPLVPVAPTTPDENRALADALVAYEGLSRQRGREDTAPLVAFLEVHPASPWRPSLLVNLGTLYRETGAFSRALDAWQAAWDASKSLRDPRGKAVGDASAARLSQFLAYLGRKELLAPLLDEVRDRPFQGTASELIIESRQGLTDMQQRPGISFRCGPLALERILAHGNAAPRPEQVKALRESWSTPDGLSLPAVKAASERAGMHYQMAFRAPGAQVILPAVAHWKVGHYAALTSEEDGVFFVEDATFGENIRVRAETLDAESSGYFLVPPGPLPQGWRSVPQSEAASVWGRGNTGINKDMGATGTSEPPAIGSGQCPGPCTQWSVEAMVVGLELVDTPIRYGPPVGPPIDIQLVYSHRDAQQPMMGFNYTNFGPKWTLNWLSYVTDNLAKSNTAVLYRRGGGAETYSFPSAGATISSAGEFSQALLTRSADAKGNTKGFVRQLPDGSTEQFTQVMGSQYFMTAITDPHGNTVSIEYDGQMRITGIKDPVDAAPAIFSYDNAFDPLKVTSITDPFGRTATFSYRWDGNLASITDMLGIESRFTYGQAPDGGAAKDPSDTDFITSLTTPYGTTRFVKGGDVQGDPNSMRSLTITDALNQTSRVEFDNDATGATGIAGSDPAGAPRVMATYNGFLNFRNTFVWDPYQLQLAASGGKLDYTKAKILHWLHVGGISTATTARVLESVKEPLERRVWFDYPGQGQSIDSGTANTVVHVGRVLDDGSTQLTTIARNPLGKPLVVTDAGMRETHLTYAPNNIDLTQVQQKTAAGLVTLASYAYDPTVAPHAPSSFTDASGQTWIYAYVPASGQLSQVTDPQGHVTKYNYETAQGGRLISIMDGNMQPVQKFHYPNPSACGPADSKHSNCNLPDSVTDSVGAMTKFDYDFFDRITDVTYPDNSHDHRDYAFPRDTAPPAGSGADAGALQQSLELRQYTDRLGHTTVYDYDAERRLTKVTDPLEHATKYDYFPNGALQALTDANGNRTSWAIDLESRPASKTYGDNTSITYGYENATSRLKTVTDALQQVKTLTYNLDDTLAAVSYGGAHNQTADVFFAYDPDFRRRTAMLDGVGLTTYQYNAITGTKTIGAGLLSSVTSPIAGTAGLGDGGLLFSGANDTADAGADASPFDAGAVPQTLTDTVNYGYDELGRVACRGLNVPCGPTPDPAAERVSFEPAGRVQAVSNPLDTFTYQYKPTDETPRVWGITTQNGGPQVAFDYVAPAATGSELLQKIAYTGRPPAPSADASAGAPFAQFGYGYYANGNIQSFTEVYPNLPSGTDAGLPNGDVSPSDGALGANGLRLSPSRGTGSGPAWTRSRDNQGTFISLTLGLLLAATGLARGGSKRVASGLTPMLLAIVFAACGNGDDSNGLPASTAPEASADGGVRQGPLPLVTQYQYDMADRLTSATQGVNGQPPASDATPQYSYVYDPASNPTSITTPDGTRNAAYTTTNAIQGGVYDFNGSPTALDGAAYSWDAENRLLSAAVNGVETDFTYDGESRVVRIVSTQNGQILSDKAYAWSGTTRLAEHDDTKPGAPTSKQYFAQGFVTGDAKKYYYVTDRLGSVRQVVDTGASLVAQYEYDPYGNELTPQAQPAAEGKQESDVGFAGYFRQPQSGLDLAVYRTYSPAQGRWPNRDPLNESKDINLYSYARTNPALQSDPLGLYPVLLVTLPNGTSYEPTTVVKNNAQAKELGVNQNTTVPIAVPPWIPDPQTLVDDWVGTFFTPLTPLDFYYYWKDPSHNFKSVLAIYDAFGNFIYGATGEAAGFTLPELQAYANFTHPELGYRNYSINVNDIASGFEAAAACGKLSVTNYGTDYPIPIPRSD